jgi:hypothetical protein
MIPRLALPLPLHLRRNSVLGISSIRAAGSRAAEHVVVLVWVRGSWLLVFCIIISALVWGFVLSARQHFHGTALTHTLTHSHSSLHRTQKEAKICCTLVFACWLLYLSFSARTALHCIVLLVACCLVLVFSSIHCSTALLHYYTTAPHPLHYYTALLQHTALSCLYACQSDIARPIWTVKGKSASYVTHSLTHSLTHCMTVTQPQIL